MAKLIDTFRDLPHKFHLPSGKAKASDKQLKQFKEYFDIRQCCKLGYPDNVSAAAYDSRLNLLAVGTKTGGIFVCGAPGVEFQAEHADQVAVIRLVFLPNEARLLSLTSDNKLHKWELNGSDEDHWHLDHAAEVEAGAADDEGQRVTAVGLVGESAWIGYDNGKVRELDIKEMKFTDLETSSEAISKSLSEEARSQVKGWSSVVWIEASQAAGAKRQVAVGFLAGPVAVLNAEAGVEAIAPCSVGLECLAWNRGGKSLLTGHSDGSQCTWPVPAGEEGSVAVLKQCDSPNTVYGPFPCAGISRLAHKTAKLGALTAFAGGLAKNTHADRHSVTVMREQDHVCYDLASPVVDLLVLCSNTDANEDAEYDEPHSLVIVSETELVAIDLVAHNWPCYRLPYLTSIAHADITVAKLYTQVSEAARTALLGAAGQQPAYSKREWPIVGGKSLAEAAEAAEADQWDLLITGHADGSVAFWRLDGARVSQLYTLDTARLFDFDNADAATHADEGAFPPFRAVGRRQRASRADDDRLAISTIDFTADLLIVGGSAGQATVWSLTDKSQEVEVDVRKVNADIVPAKDAYEWEGPVALKVREEAVNFSAPLQPSSIVLLHPPAPVTAAAYSQRWGLLSVGTSHGLAVIDTANNKCLSVHSTLPPVPTAADQQQPQQSSGGSQLTKSLRQSFRRFKKLRGGKKQEYTVNDETKDDKKEEKKKDKKKDKKEEKKEGEEKKEEKEEEKKEETAAEEAAGDQKEEAKEEAKPATADAEPKKEEADAAATEETKEEGAVAAVAEDGAGDSAAAPAAAAAESEPAAAAAAAPTPQKLGPGPSAGLVRCLTFADTHLQSPSARAPTLFAGDSSGRVYAFQLTLASGEGEAAKEAKVELLKELHLRHGAPVVCVLPIGAGRSHAAVTDAAAEEAAGPHELLVVSEEQVKLFSLPGLKPRCKARLTGQGSQQHRVRSCGYGQFESSQRPESREYGLAVCNTNGETLVLSVPHLKLHALHQAKCKLPLTFAGQTGSLNPLAVRLDGSGLLSVVAVSSKACRYALKAIVELEEGMRPKPAAAVEPEANAAANNKEGEAKKEGEEGQEAATATAEEEGNKTAETVDDKEAPADLDKSGATPVAADITMDDIKEYATGGTVPPTETIPETNEDKRESAVSADEPKQSEPAANPPADVAEVKVNVDVNEPPAAEVTATADDSTTKEE